MMKNDIQGFLNIKIHEHRVDYEILDIQRETSFDRYLIQYLGSEQDVIRAFLFIPQGQALKGAVLVHHQHNSERHLGKSEVAGLAGDPFQFFCPDLARSGIIALAPDSICFEDRRPNTSGKEPDPSPEKDFLQHYNEMCYRLLKGSTLMKKVVEDSSIGISLLSQLDGVEKGKIGILGHSYGGNTVIFHSPFDDRIKFSCSSGAVCSYRKKMSVGTGIEMAEVIPGFVEKYDIADLLCLVAPRNFLMISSSQDIYAQDASAVYRAVKPGYERVGAASSLMHEHFSGEHQLDQERFEYMINWFVTQFQKDT